MFLIKMIILLFLFKIDNFDKKIALHTEDNNFYSF